MKKTLAMLLTAVLLLGLAGCGGTASSSSAAKSAAPASGSASAASSASASAKTKSPAECKIGVIQLTEHVALDAARKGFVDAMVAAGFSEANIDVQNAQGEIPNCATIATKFVNDKVDLILAIATPAAQAAAQATTSIPILATAVTDFEVAGLVKSNNAPGGNVSGTSDMNPVKEQADLLKQLVPGAKNVGIVYCSAEDNSVLQAGLAKKALEALGMKVTEYTAADVNDIQPVLTKACAGSDALYIPTDNLFAGNMATVALVAEPAKIPVICGESGMVAAGGTATYGLDYYTLGKMAAAQAVDILVNGKNISTIPVGFASANELKFAVNEANCKAIGLTIPDELKQKLK